MNDRIVYINTDDFKEPAITEDIMEGRRNVALAQQQLGQPLVTIRTPAYNRLEKTKRCVESVLKYTEGIDFEWLLYDNGSSDGTLEYLESIPYEKKKIIRTTKNQGAGFALGYNGIMEMGRYIVDLSNDVIVTKDWLKNLLICAESDPSIGMVCPAASNISNLQQVTIPFDSYEQMQVKAAEYNQTDPGKWEERLRLMTVIALYKKEAVMAVGFPMGDSGFFHDFGDDDLSFRLRRMGYKLILAKDVWVHHDHPFGPDSGRDPVKFQKSLSIGRQNFRDKYNGIDAWDDVNRYMTEYSDHIKKPRTNIVPRILGIDVRCGTPILEIKNKLRQYGCLKAHTSAFSQDTKYELDLKSICDENVFCDREEFLSDYFPIEAFDYIVVDKPVNCYHEPQKLINDVMSFARPGAQILFTLNNTYSFYEFMNMLGQRNVYNQEFSYNISLEAFHGALKKYGEFSFLYPKRLALQEEQKEILSAILKSIVPEHTFDECFVRLTTDKFVIGIEKR